MSGAGSCLPTDEPATAKHQSLCSSGGYHVHDWRKEKHTKTNNNVKNGERTKNGGKGISREGHPNERGDGKAFEPTNKRKKQRARARGQKAEAKGQKSETEANKNCVYLHTKNLDEKVQSKIEPKLCSGVHISECDTAGYKGSQDALVHPSFFFCKNQGEGRGKTGREGINTKKQKQRLCKNKRYTLENDPSKTGNHGNK